MSSTTHPQKMISTIAAFYRKHKRQILWACGTIGAGLLVARVFVQKRAEYFAQQQNLLKQRVKRKYQQTQQDCLFTIIALLPTLSGAVYKLIPVNSITKQLINRRRKKGSIASSGVHSSDLSNTDDNVDPDNVSKIEDHDNDNNDESQLSKSELWDELKLQSLTRLITLIYTNSLLTILVRLQLNILARKDYLELSMEVENLQGNAKGGRSIAENSAEGGNDIFVIEQSYLSMSWWLLNNGYLSVHEKCQEAVRTVFKDINAKTELTFNEFSVLVAKSQELIDKSFVDSGDNFLERCILPTSDLETLVVSKSCNKELDSAENVEYVSSIVEDENFKILMQETREYINKDPEMNLVFISMITSSLSIFLNNCSNFFFGDASEQQVDMDIITKRFKLVKILSILIKETTKISESSNNNEYIQAVNKVSELEEFTASVYSNFAL